MANIVTATDNRPLRVNLWRRATSNNSDGQEDDLISRDNPTTDGDGDNSRREGAGAGGQGEPEVKYTSQLAALFIIVNVTVGVGLLAMPSAMQDAGLVTSFIVQVVFLAMIMTTCIMATELTCHSGVDSYHKLVQVHCHPFVYQFTQVSILLMVFGTAVAYIVLIGDQADRIFASVYGPTFCVTWYMNRRFIMSALTVFVMKPLCAAKTVDFLKYGSFLGIISIAFIIYVVISEFLKIDKIPDSVNYFPKHITDIGSILPVFCFAYQCHLSWVPIVASIKREEKRKAFVTISVGMFIATIVYAVVSILAVLTFGSKIAEDLTESYPGKQWSILTTIGIVAFKCVVTLPPAFLPARLSIVDIMKDTFKWYADFSEPVQRISATFLTLDLALLLALFVPNILTAVNVLGCLAVMFVFTLPGLSYLSLIRLNRIKKQQETGEGDIPIYSAKDKFKIALSYFMVAFGSLIMLLVLYKSIASILSKSSVPPLCVVP